MFIPYKAAVLVLMILFVSNPAGCRLRPQESIPPGDQGTPPLPGALDGDSGEEPRLRVYMHETGDIREMAFEEYIEGVVAGEMDPQWHENALGAQAIIARSFTLQKIAEDGGVPEREAHASTDIEEFQAYDADEVTEQVRRAVENTRGLVAVHDGEYIRGWFHAFAGPRTALADEGLEYEGGNPPYIRIVESPGEDIIPDDEANWSASFSLSQVREAVTEITGSDPGTVENVAVSEKGPSGRATQIKVNDAPVPAPSLRIALDSTVMRSTFIDEMELQGDSLNMSGSGYGHGVGMCQWGARALAEEGWSCEDIVDYFYGGIDVVRAWE